MRQTDDRRTKQDLLRETIDKQRHNEGAIRTLQRQLANVIEWQAALQTALGMARLAMDRAGIEDTATTKAVHDLDDFYAIDSGRNAP